MGSARGDVLLFFRCECKEGCSFVFSGQIVSPSVREVTITWFAGLKMDIVITGGLDATILSCML